MNTVYDPQQREVNPDEVVTYLADLLRSAGEFGATLTRGTQASISECIFEHYLPDEVTPKCAVVRLVDQTGGVAPTFTGAEPVQVQCMLMAAPDTINRRIFFNEAGRMVKSLWTRKWSELAPGQQVVKPLRRVRVQREPRFDNQAQRWYKTDTYSTSIRPMDNV